MEYVERVYRIIAKDKTGKKKEIFIKKDLWGADGIAMNENEIIFWNAKTGKKHLSEGVKEFEKYSFPIFVKKWIISWIPGQKEPIVREV